MNIKSISIPKNQSGRDTDNDKVNHYFARLMTPSEVLKATTHQPVSVQKNTAGNWVLSGDVSAEMFSCLQKASGLHFPLRLTGFKSSSGLAYCCLTHQVKNFQSRLILPLYDEKVLQLLEALTQSEKLTFSLGNNDEEQALLLPCPLKRTDLLPILAMASGTSNATKHEVLSELPFLLPEFSHPLRVPTLVKGVKTGHVSVSLLLPSTLNEYFNERFSEGALQ